MTSTFYGLTDTTPAPKQSAALTKQMDKAVPKRTAMSKIGVPATMPAVKVR